MPGARPATASSRRMLEAGVHAFLQHARRDRPQTPNQLEAIIDEISRVDAGAANMIQLALRENSAADFIAALNAEPPTEPTR